MRSTLLLTAALALLAGACSRTKPTAEQPKPVEPPPGVTVMYIGTITLAEEGHGCPVLVKVDGIAGKPGPTLIPIGLDEKFLVEGQRIKFSYRASRASSGACKQGDPAILENIAAVNDVAPRQTAPLPDK